MAAPSLPSRTVERIGKAKVRKLLGQDKDNLISKGKRKERKKKKKEKVSLPSQCYRKYCLFPLPGYSTEQ